MGHTMSMRCGLSSTMIPALLSLWTLISSEDLLDIVISFSYRI